jgi:hypothetical protein
MGYVQLQGFVALVWLDVGAAGTLNMQGQLGCCWLLQRLLRSSEGLMLLL